MADYFPALVAELKTTAMTEWSLDEDHFFTSLQALRNNIVSQIARNEANGAEGLSAPLGVMEVGHLTADDSYGLQNECKRARVKFWYVDRVRKGRDNQAFVHGKAYDLGHLIDAGAFTYFQSIDHDCSIDSSAKNEANAEFLEAQVELIAACVYWEPGLLVGTTP